MTRTMVSEAERGEGRAFFSAGVRTLYVYLCNGDVEAVRPAAGLACSQEDLIVFDCAQEVARFPRAEVYLASYDRISPPILF